jgi:protein SCO1/2/putative membrane protein
MDWISKLPALNATLNATAAVLLVRGYLQIREGKRVEHRKTMLTAFSVSVVFLISYLIYHFNIGSKRFEHEGMIRNLYISILLSHTVLAAAVPFLAVITLRRGLKNDLRRHAKLARITFPIWLYVSVTGVVVYMMLYWM